MNIQLIFFDEKVNAELAFITRYKRLLSRASVNNAFAATCVNYKASTSTCALVNAA